MSIIDRQLPGRHFATQPAVAVPGGGGHPPRACRYAQAVGCEDYGYGRQVEV